MNSRERFLTAMTGGEPDRVPCTPDFSNMIPCRLTGKPFWDIYLYDDPPLWQAYLEAAKYFGIDPWFFNGTLDFEYNDGVPVASKQIISKNDDFIVQRNELATPAGVLTGETTYCRADPPTQTVKYIKDIAADFGKLRYLFREPSGYKTGTARLQKASLGEEYAFGTYVIYPGFQGWVDYFEGAVEPLAFAEMDCPELLEELRALHERVVLRQLEMILDSKLFDYVLLAGSGSVTLASPELFDKYAFPTIQKITHLCKQAGLPTMLHSCGKEKHVAKRCAEDSDLDCINPLEIPPMGDCKLAEIKQLYGAKVALMGNLHTTEVMLYGTPTEVEQAAKKCIDDAGGGGGFILSTGDQCGRDTPDANIRKLVEVCETYGRYQK